MKKETKEDFSNYTKDELIKMLIEKDKSFSNLEAKFYRLQLKCNKLLKQAENKTFIIKRENINKFQTDAEHESQKIVINEAEEKAKVGRRKGSKNFEGYDLEEMAQKTTIKDLDIKTCPKCKTSLVKFGEDVSYKVYTIPSEYYVEKIVTYKYKCPKCGQIFENTNEDIFSHSILTPSLAASIVNAKYTLGVPLNRYKDYICNKNIKLSEVDLANYVMRTADVLLPLYNELKKCLVNTSCNVINADETTLEVLDNFKENRTKSYIFVYCSSFYDYSIYLYDFSKDRKTTRTKEILDGFKGYLICDDYPGYNELTKNGITLQRCWAHARRKFYDIVKTLDNKSLKDSKAKKVVDLMDKLFHQEEIFRAFNLNPDEIYLKRDSKEYLDLLNSINIFVNSLNPEKDTPLDGAVRYFKKVWPDLITFLKDGHIDLTNNIAERAVKPFVICRKNFLFSKTERGATASAIIFTIIQTATANSLDPEDYITYVLNNINKLTIEKLLPWDEDLTSKVKKLV